MDQDYPNVEYIVVDGGSTDGTVEILKKYEGRLVWISEEDQGQADAINKGFRMAKGDVLGWLNSDDTYLPGAIRKIVDYFQRHPDVGMVYGEGYNIDASGNVIERFPTEPFDFERLAKRCFISQPTAFFRAEVYRAVGPLDVNLNYCLDYDYWIRVANRFRIGHLNEYLANSRLHMSAKTISRQLELINEVLRTVRNHYGQVPPLWIYIYTHCYLNDKLTPNIYGLYEDGWVSQRLLVSLPVDWASYSCLCLEGVVPLHLSPLQLRITLDHQVLHEAVIKAGRFSIKQQIPKVGGRPYGSNAVEMEVCPDKSFVPQMLGIGDDVRPLSFRVKRLAFIDGRGKERVTYSDWQVWIRFFLLPLLFLLKFCLVNRSFPYTELWSNRRKWWRNLKRYSLSLVRSLLER